MNDFGLHRGLAIGCSFSLGHKACLFNAIAALDDLKGGHSYLCFNHYWQLREVEKRIVEMDNEVLRELCAADIRNARRGHFQYPLKVNTTSGTAS